jgi:hypothetical protein
LASRVSRYNDDVPADSQDTLQALKELVRKFYGSAADRTVVVGAGASVDAGLPAGATLHSALANSVDFYRDVARNIGESSDVERVFRAIEQIATARDVRSASSDLLQGLQIPTDLSTAAEQAGAALSAITTRLKTELWLPLELLPDPAITERVAYLQPLVRAQRSGTIVSLNYDNCLERADPSAYSVAPYQKRVEVPPELPDKTRIVKLHGSLDWQKIDDDVVIGGRPREARPYEPGIIFGAGNKLRYYGPFLALFQAFVERVRRSRVIITIGYGFRDEHVNDVIRIWAEDDRAYDYTNPKYLFVGVGPGTAALPDFVTPWERFDHMRPYEHSGAAKDFIPTVFAD